MPSTSFPLPEVDDPTTASGAEPRWDVRLFGVFRLSAPDGSDATPVGRKARALVAYLIAADGATVPRDRLAALLWSERGPEQARASLRQVLYELRGLTAGDAPPLRLDRTGARVAPERLGSDRLRMQWAAASADAEAMAALLGDRPADLLVDLDGLDPDFDDWLAIERVRLGGERRRNALVAAERALAAGDATAAHRIATRLSSCDATDEAAARLAMEASHRQGDRDAMRQTFAQVREALRVQLGVEPADETATLHRRLTTAGIPARTAERPAVSAANDNPPADPVADESLGPPPSAPDAPRPPSARSRPRLFAAAGLSVLAAAAYVAWPPPTGAGIRTLQFEPLRSAPTDSSAMALRVGLSADVASFIVGNEKSLRVFDAPEPMQGVTAGSFRIGGEASSDAGLLHVTIRLSRQSGGPILWSSTFVRPAADVEAMREEIASKISDVAVCAHGRKNPQAASFDVEEMQLMLAACANKHATDPEEVSKLYWQLVALRPDYAHAWAVLAADVEILAEGTPADAPAHAEAERLVRHALALDPGEGEAYYAMGLRLRHIDQWKRQMDVLQKGHTIDPANGQVDSEIAFALERVGRWREAASFRQQALNADPFSASKTAKRARLLAFDGDADDAIAAVATGRRRFGKHCAIAHADLEIQALFGDPARARAILADNAREPRCWAPTEALWAGIIAARAAPTAAHEAALDRLIHDTTPTPDNIGIVVEALARRDRVDDAYAFIERMGVDLRDRLPFTMLFGVLTRNLRADPRFMTVAARAGLIAAWQQGQAWADFCDAGGVPYDCRTEAQRALSATPRALTATSG